MEIIEKRSIWFAESLYVLLVIEITICPMLHKYNTKMVYYKDLFCAELIYCCRGEAKACKLSDAQNLTDDY